MAQRCFFQTPPGERSLGKIREIYKICFSLSLSYFTYWDLLWLDPQSQTKKDNLLLLKQIGGVFAKVIMGGPVLVEGVSVECSIFPQFVFMTELKGYEHHFTDLAH